jgi:hypothetical protein|tara:strand:- start:131 stop:388 length:258 start_codon:yes stop_codon:yes gene_type:complete
MTTKQRLLEQLRDGVTTVSFTKVNGERRDMQCTLNETLLPERPETVETADVKPVHKDNPAVQRVWDVNANGWRSFRWENVIQGEL